MPDRVRVFSRSWHQRRAGSAGGGNRYTDLRPVTGSPGRSLRLLGSTQSPRCEPQRGRTTTRSTLIDAHTPANFAMLAPSIEGEDVADASQWDLSYEGRRAMERAVAVRFPVAAVRELNRAAVNGRTQTWSIV